MSEEEYEDIPWIQGPLCVFSFGCVFLYCFLRESNDIDEKLNRTLFEQVPHLERPMIEIAVKNLENQGIDTTKLRARLAELDELEMKIKGEDIKQPKETIDSQS